MKTSVAIIRSFKSLKSAFKIGHRIATTVVIVDSAAADNGDGKEIAQICDFGFSMVQKNFG